MPIGIPDQGELTSLVVQASFKLEEMMVERTDIALLCLLSGIISGCKVLTRVLFYFSFGGDDTNSASTSNRITPTPTKYIGLAITRHQDMGNT